ncbi:A24 family peptidase [Cohnella caldifontis]|uniref:A24 family peptidase n=1 Tax=Cohnella caldifontis TaxID=3027471 RepID=UPI0023ECD8FB|nr:A24 family peptidase [Cohnella sp. YIM B05605]
MNAVLLSVSAICAATDLKSRKIYNAVVFPALAAALILRVALGGWPELADGLLGFAAGLGILLIPYLLGGMGAGDVKLLAVVGALKGAAFVLAASFCMAAIGAVLALGVMLRYGGVRSRIRQWGLWLLCLRLRIWPSPSRGAAEAVTYPYGVAIAGGAVLCWALEGWGAA